jgi:large subunit ribosomal protein L24e
MVEQKICSFCGVDIEPGTGKMHVKKDGTIYLFCAHKCYMNMIKMKRVPRRTEWTRAYAVAKGIAKTEKHDHTKDQKAQPVEEKVESEKKPKALSAPKKKAEKKSKDAPAEEKKAEKKSKAKPAEEKKA